LYFRGKLIIPILQHWIYGELKVGVEGRFLVGDTRKRENKRDREVKTERRDVIKRVGLLYRVYASIRARKTYNNTPAKAATRAVI